MSLYNFFIFSYIFLLENKINNLKMSSQTKYFVKYIISFRDFDKLMLIILNIFIYLKLF